MGLDLRFPLGLMFLTIGALMLGYGVLTWHSAIYAQSLGLNMNVFWGSVMVVFGGLMFFLARRASSRQSVTEGTAVSHAPRH